MKLAACIVILALSAHTLFADDSDNKMPRVVREAKDTVEVFMRYSSPTGRCFPDPSARVRMVNGVVMLSDFKLYPNMKPNFSDGLVAFEKNGKWGACDEDGDVRIRPQFDSFIEFDKGFASASSDGKVGFIDKRGKWVIPPRFDPGRLEFLGQLCLVRVGGKKAIINRSGQYVWKPGSLKEAENMGGNIYVQTTDKKSGFLDADGNPIPNKNSNNRDLTKK